MVSKCYKLIKSVKHYGYLKNTSGIMTQLAGQRRQNFSCRKQRIRKTNNSFYITKQKIDKAGKINIEIRHLPLFLNILVLSGQFLWLPILRKPGSFMLLIKSHICGFRILKVSSKISYESTIQEYTKVNRTVKKEVKKAKRKQVDEKIKKLEDDFKKNDSHSLFKSVSELEGKPKKSLMVAKNQKKYKSTKAEEVLKIWKKTF